MVNKLYEKARWIPWLDELEIKLLAKKYGGGRIANIAMFHTGRCGSTVLGDMLGQHPDFFWASEIFEDISIRYPWLKNGKDKARRCIERSMYSQRKMFYGFETKFLPELHLRSDCADMSLDKYVKMLKYLHFSHFIILHRKNYLRRAVSAAIGRKTNEWHSKEQKNVPTRVKIDLENFPTGNRTRPFLEHLQLLEESYSDIETLLENSNVLKLIYEEDILENPNIGCKKIADFLKIDTSSFDTEVRFKRTNPFRLEEMIINYAEVAALLTGTKYEWMLFDE